MIRVRCFRCKSELDAPGAILLSPRDMGDHAVKKHFCVRCHGVVFTPVERHGCCDVKSGGMLLSPPDRDDRVLVVRLCTRHYQAALKKVSVSLGQVSR